VKVLFVNTTEVEGGAARGALRLLRGVRSAGVDARLLVEQRSSEDPEVISPSSRGDRMRSFLGRVLDATVVGLSRRGGEGGVFSAPVLPDALPAAVRALQADVVHLHWVARGMVNIETLRRLGRPVVWTLHDSWVFTGGCHVPLGCTRYRDACGHCPVLGSSRERDLSRWVWNRKRRAWRDLPLTFVTPSRWLGDCARSSSLLREARVEVISNGLDPAVFRPLDKRAARDALGLPQDRKLILFGAKGATSDRNKGLHLLLPALQGLASRGWGDRADLVLFGSPPSGRVDAGLPVHERGWFHDDLSLALLYSAADVFVAPSLLEALGYVIMEAMACGTPAVAFRQGGVPDLVEHQESGYLARPYEPDDLGRGIAWVLEDEARWQRLAARSREKVVREFDIAVVARRHIELYRALHERTG
jgi:glycosyltransferase involved in cell wall biosynthesis